MDNSKRVVIVHTLGSSIANTISYLEKLGFSRKTMHIARTCEELLRYVLLQKVDLIILDEGRESVDDPYAVCRNIKEQDDIKNIPVFISPCVDDGLGGIKAIGARAEGFLKKPLNNLMGTEKALNQLFRIADLQEKIDTKWSSWGMSNV